MSKTTDKVIQLAEEQMLVQKALTQKSTKLKTVNIKGKPYVTVDERVKFFRDNYKGYTSVTEITHLTEETVIIKAVIKNSEDRIISTGHAYEQITSYGVNSTNHIENCETSAIGRALGFMNIGVISSIASADEVKNAIAKQSKVKPSIDEETFNKALQAIEAGTYTADKLKAKFSLDTNQLKTLQSC
tara:strand:- start:334 stop:894 length:561 start_codon:yes stop_codon:yes gene_type:complete